MWSAACCLLPAACCLLPAACCERLRHFIGLCQGLRNGDRRFLVLYDPVWFHWNRIILPDIVRIDDLELFGIVLVEIGYRHPDIREVVIRDIRNLVHVDCIVVVVLRIQLGILVVALAEDELLMTI